MGTDTRTDTGMDKKSINRPTTLRSTAVLVGAALTVQLVSAQSSEKSAAPKQDISVSPRIAITETWTDNLRLSTVGETELVTEVRPGLRVDLNKARLKGFFDYSLSGFSYAKSTAAIRNVNTLSSNLKLEAIDNTLFLDASGSIGEQAASAFGAQSIDNTSINANRTEVSTYRIAPSLKGNMGVGTTYSAQYSRSVISTGSIGASNSATNELTLNFKGDLGAMRLGWTVDFVSQDVRFSAGRSTENSKALLGLVYTITPLFEVAAAVGNETQNYTSIAKESNPVSGVGLSWRPREATKLTAILFHHSYGDTYTISFDHRTGRTAWQYTDSKTSTQTPNLQGATGTSSAYDLYYAQFATTEPDPVARAQLVNSYLQTYGIAPGATVNTGFVASSLALQHRRQLSFALLGKRDTITFIATQSESTRLDTLTNAIDDFTASPTVRQQGWIGNFAHRLTPDFTIGLLVSQINSNGTLSTQSTDLRNVNLSLTGKVGKKSTATLAVRKVDSTNSVIPYSESALTATINLQF
jgi:uncharacterized protein (PEP-CTERM system associated)